MEKIVKKEMKLTYAICFVCSSCGKTYMSENCYCYCPKCKRTNSYSPVKSVIYKKVYDNE